MQNPMILQYCLLLSILLLSLQQLPTYAVHKQYIVYLGSHHAEPRLTASPETITKSHHELISSVLRSDSESSSERIIYSYNKIFNGFGATLHEEEANELAKHPKVVSIFESRMLEPATTRSADFLGLHYPPSNLKDSIWHKSNFGEDVIIANIDTGVWPEIQSFSDEGYGPIPKKFKGACENKHDPTFKCNRKLIGARYFHKGMLEMTKIENCSFNNELTPRDKHGHGTHTLSTAGGNIVASASWGGLGNGTAKGMAPKARLVAYRTAWSTVGCSRHNTEGKTSNGIDTMAAFEAAIDDNVDIINYSQGPFSGDFFEDGQAVASFHAMKNGILTVACAGNKGPNPQTLSNNYPWVLSVAASTIDRSFSAHVLLGNHQNLKGAGFFDIAKVNDSSILYPLITGADARISGADTSEASLCQQGTIDVAKVEGKILVCNNPGSSFGSDETSASKVAKQAGAVGMIFVYDKEIGDGFTLSQVHTITTIVLSYKEGQTLFSYINSTRAAPTAAISSATDVLGVKPFPTMAIFSSRGPNHNTPGILKPDVTAPGVDILAACPTNIYQNPFCMLSGTSMATPHVAGIAALIKKLHPDWSTAAIKSAIMTTASPLDSDGMPIRENDKKSDATPFAYGSGHVKPNAAMDPGLVYDMNHYDYLNFLCAYPHDSEAFREFSQKHSYKCPASFNILDFNYPSISIVNFTGNAVVTRKLKNVGQPGTYVPRIEPPPGVSIAVEPKTLVFSHKDQTIMFKLTFTADVNHLSNDYIFGSLVWSDAKHVVRSPIMVKAKNK